MQGGASGMLGGKPITIRIGSAPLGTLRLASTSPQGWVAR
jgi:hypothetical protein